MTEPMVFRHHTFTQELEIRPQFFFIKLSDSQLVSCRCLLGENNNRGHQDFS